MKTFLKALPLFLSFVAIEYLAYFFIYFAFHTDIAAVSFLRSYPLVLRLPVIIAFLFSFISIFYTEEQRYIFIAISANMVFLGLFFEIVTFNTIPNPIHIFIDIYYRIRYIIRK